MVSISNQKRTVGVNLTKLGDSVFEEEEKDSDREKDRSEENQD